MQTPAIEMYKVTFDISAELMNNFLGEIGHDLSH